MMRATGPFVALGWIGSILLGAAALLVLAAQLIDPATPPVWIDAAGVALLIVPSLLLLPPLWRGLRIGWLNAIRVIVAIVMAYFGLFVLPAASHIIRPDAPIQQ